jgi:YVTN family beta-propeller protein
MTMKKIISVLILSSTIFFSCKKDSPDPISSPTFTGTESGGVLISNEGNYGQSNSSLSYLSVSGSAFNDVYTIANQSALGDILNSMSLCNGKLYLVVNNSAKIEVCNPTTLKKIKTINGAGSPRTIVQVATNKAYVTDLFSNSIHILNLATDSIEGSIGLQGWSEEMVLLNGKVYVTNYNSDKIYSIDPVLDLVIDSIPVAAYGASLTADVNGKLWLLSIGQFYTQPYSAGELHRVDPVTRQIEFSYQFPIDQYPAKLRKNASGTKLYMISNGIFCIAANDSIFPSQPLIAAATRNLYGLGIDAAGNIFTSDAMNFVQKGKVYKYDMNGNQLASFQAGIAPGEFLFIP